VSRWHWIGALVAAIVAFFSILHLFPSEAECVASGRSVDPTRRHCDGPNGYVQLREHVMFHSREPIILIVIIGGAMYVVRRRRRRHDAGPGTTQPNLTNDSTN
jgi:hypothetical protein